MQSGQRNLPLPAELLDRLDAVRWAYTGIGLPLS